MIQIIQQEPSSIGAYPPIQQWPKAAPPAGYYTWLDGVNTDLFYAYNGFVILNVFRNAVIGYEPNKEAWQKWKAENEDS